MVKYLYGKKEFLEPVVDGRVGFRFSDLSNYARLENEKMKDDELYKSYFINKYDYEISINDHVIDRSSMSGDPMFSCPAQHCFCLCLSNKGNCDFLYEQFEADICIEINVCNYIDSLKRLFQEKFKGMRVIAKNIIYYNEYEILDSYSPEELVFFKPEIFAHENEYRIALLYPKNKSSFKAVDGKVIPFYNESESTHITISPARSDYVEKYISRVYKR